MTTLSPKTLFRTGSAADQKLSRLIGAARLLIGAERTLPALWPALGFVGLYLALALTGLYAFIPWPVQALGLAATFTTIGLSLERSFAALPRWWPSWWEGARRLEQDSALKHRPISEGQDRLIGNDPFALELWRLHRARQLVTGALRLRPRLPDLSARDPFYLRYGAAVVVAAGLVLAGANWQTRLLRAFDSGAGLAVTLDAWLDPPAYTGLPPVYLAPGDKSLISVPAGSILNLRAHNATHAPGLSLGGALGLSGAPRLTGDNGEYSGTVTLSADARVRVRANGHVIGDWRVHAIADALPVIRFDAAPSATERQATKISFHASDDYGVTGARLVMVPHGRGGAPLIADLPLPPGKRVAQTNYVDLTAHPYAGLTVDAYLEARDGAGQSGRSPTIAFRLPARVFTDPLARALIEQRQNLATADAPGRKRVAAALDALAFAPDKFYQGRTGLYLGLRAAFRGLNAARVPSDIAHVQDLLWQMAVSLEQQGLLDAAQALRQLQMQILQALAARAPQDVIDELLKKYDQAMQRYMQALANDPSAQAKQQQPVQDQNAKTITEKDLQDILKTIQQLSASGNREQAAQMMAMLQNLMENLKLSPGGGGGNGSPQNKALNDAIQKFSDMMGEQRGLLDKTMREKNGNGDPKDGGAQGLANQQRALRKKLDDALKGLDPKLTGKLGAAGSAMDRAQQSLDQKNLENAGNEEKNALDALRQGAEALAQEAQPDQNGRRGEADDPLGRARGTGTGVKIPGMGDLARAREILQELRKRAGERGRPQQELDYYDRLLKEF